MFCQYSKSKCTLLVCHTHLACVVFADKEKGPRRLMRKGLVLILVGHINFILGAIVHGSVLRHISKPSQEITTEYTAVNIISVTSGLLVSSSIHSCIVSNLLRQCRSNFSCLMNFVPVHLL